MMTHSLRHDFDHFKYENIAAFLFECTGIGFLNVT
jgi:hypothetical protein